MKSISMDEIQKKLSQRYEARPRKVRFKISSAYSGRVLKQVYEDGQELAPPEEESTHRFLHHTFESGDHFYRAGETPASRFYSSAKLTAQRISIFKEGSKYNLTSNTPLFSDFQASDSHHRVENTTDSRFRWFCFSSIQEFQNALQTLINEAPPSPKKPSPILDFGKIVIYTSNLKIIRTPMDKKELMRKIIQNEGTDDCPFMYQDGNEGDGHQINGHVEDAENQLSHNQTVQGRRH